MNNGFWFCYFVSLRSWFSGAYYIQNLQNYKSEYEGLKVYHDLCWNDEFQLFVSLRPAVLCAAVQNARGTAVIVLKICLMPGSLEGFV